MLRDRAKKFFGQDSDSQDGLFKPLKNVHKVTHYVMDETAVIEYGKKEKIEIEVERVKARKFCASEVSVSKNPPMVVFKPKVGKTFICETGITGELLYIDQGR